MRSRFTCLFISSVGGIVGFVLTIITLITFMHMTTLLNYNMELYVINPTTSHWKNGTYYCKPSNEYSKILEKSNKDTEYFYSYDFYYKLYEYPVLPYLNIFIVALLDLFFMNIVYLAIYLLISMPFLEVFKCANPTITLIYTILILVLCAILCCMCVFLVIFYTLRIKCGSELGDMTLNDDTEESPNNDSTTKETINTQLLDV